MMKIIRLIICLCIVGGYNLSHAQLYIDGVLTVQDEALIFADSDVMLVSANTQLINAGDLILSGDLSKDTDATMESPNEGKRTVTIVENSSTTIHHIQGDFSNNDAFYNLEINLGSDTNLVDIDSDIHVSNSLEITKGILRTDIISYDTDGAEYANAVFIDNTNADALQLTSPIDEEGPYVEGKLTRKMNVGEYLFPVGLSNSIQGKQPIIVSTSEGDDNYLTIFFQEGSTTQIGLTSQCDLGPAPNYDQPDGVIDNIIIDCVYGQWVPFSEADFEHGVTLYPSSTISLCDDAVLLYAGLNGSFEDCPSFTTDGSVSRENIASFGVYDIATSTAESISTATIEVNGKEITTKVYPNPSIIGNPITIEIIGIDGLESSYTVFNLLGQEVLSERVLINGNNTIDTNRLSKGQYMIKMQVGTISTAELIFIR